MAVRVLYFAWVREKIGKSEDVLELPASIRTVADLISHLRTLGDEYRSAFAHPEVVRAALDQTHVKPSAEIAGAREIAFFPPVTGG